MVVTTLVFGARASLREKSGTQLRWHNLWLLLAYVLFMVVSGFYVAKIDIMFRVLPVQEGRQAPYPGFAEDALRVMKMVFFLNPGLWFTLWSVKFALLALYKKFMVSVPLHTRWWWAVLIYCILTLIISIILQITACSPPSGWFRNDTCQPSPRRMRRFRISLWQAFAADLTSDLMIMFLPINLIRNLQLPRSKKLSIVALFSLGGLCMLASILRVVQVGKSAKASTGPPPLPWLALWSIIESSIAVMVGCGPGFYRKATSASKSQHTPYSNHQSLSRGSNSRNPDAIDAGLVLLRPLPSHDIGLADKTGSHEKLVGIKVTQSFNVIEET
ncbi:hypothetical protein SVAN01_01488 [Stagonosporopsis vannaccii]|nr:hypothetical protein SVAN01_01488 [Stagonosporopsis vannaccii]